MPSLPILPAPGPDAASRRARLVRQYHALQARWTSHFSDDEQIDAGVAWTNPKLPRVHIANRIFDAAIPGGSSAARTFQGVEDHFLSRGTKCWQWVMSPTASPAVTEPLVRYLTSRKYVAEPLTILALEGESSANMVSVAAPDRLMIIPARASFRYAESIYTEMKARWSEPQLVEASLLHLDDPHCESLIAVHDGAKAVAHVAVLAMGDVGMIEDVLVSADYRGRGIGTLMLRRALEIARRSMFKDLLVGVAPENEGALRLYRRFGFAEVGNMVVFDRPSDTHQ